MLEHLREPVLRGVRERTSGTASTQFQTALLKDSAFFGRGCYLGLLNRSLTSLLVAFFAKNVVEPGWPIANHVCHKRHAQQQQNRQRMRDGDRDWGEHRDRIICFKAFHQSIFHFRFVTTRPHATKFLQAREQLARGGPPGAIHCRQAVQEPRVLQHRHMRHANSPR